MSTQSATGFEWSVKLVGAGFRTGIASQLELGNIDFYTNDKNAILYCPSSKTIKNESKLFHSNLPERKDEDVMRFRFQPHAKKLVVNLKVRVFKLHIDLK